MGSSPSKEKIYSAKGDARKFHFDGRKWVETYVNNNGNSYMNDSDTIFIGVLEMLKKLGFRIVIKNKSLLKMVKDTESNCVQAVLNIDMEKKPFTIDIDILKDFKLITRRSYDIIKYSTITKYIYESGNIIKSEIMDSGRRKIDVGYKISSLNNFELLEIKLLSNEKEFYVIEFQEEDFFNNAKLLTDYLDKI